MASRSKLGEGLTFVTAHKGRDCGEPNNKKRKLEYKSVWEEGRPCLYFDDNQDGMFCKLCKKWERKHRSGKRVWNEAPCICIRSNSVLRHEQSDQHKEAVELEKAKQQSERDGGIVHSFDKIWEVEEKSLKSALMCLYWLCKEVPHCSKFGKLLDLVDLLDKDVLLDLKKGANASYRSHRSISEFLSLISKNICDSNLEEMKSSPVISLMIDETTDISTS